MNPILPFTLERAYREHFATGMVDLSSSSPQPLTAREALEEAGVGVESLVNAPLDYEPSGGGLALRGAIASLYGGVSASEVLVTAGAAEAIRVVAEAAIQPGDRVVVQRPVYEPLRAAPLARGAEVLDWAPSSGFQFAFDGLPDGAATAAVVLLNNPHGPSGSLVRGAYAGSARLVADEVYRPASINAAHRAPSVVDVVDGAVSVGDLSKPLGLGGLRIGWIVSRDAAFMRGCAGALEYYSGSVATLSARVAQAAIDGFDTHLDRQVARARVNLRALTTFVEQHERWIDWGCPQAGYTAFLRLKGGMTAAGLATRMRARGIFLLDGAVFDSPDHVRIGFGLEGASFARALKALGEELRSEGGSSAAVAPDGDVILLAKQPLPGHAKTRLAADVGAEAATALCAAFIRDSCEFAEPRARRLYIAASPPESVALFGAMAPGARCFAQPDAAFGDRLAHAFETVITDGGRRPVLIGSDSPTLPAHLLTVAQTALRTHDVVLGPADDGGYYLIGMNDPQRALFEGIDWSTEVVLSQTLERARELGLSVFVLPAWYDVDCGRDLDRLQADPLVRVHTRRAIEEYDVAGVVS